MDEFLIPYEDDEICIVLKPQGIATTPGKQPDLCTQLFSYRPELALVNGYQTREGGLLNRLDNETGGLVLFAKSDDAFKYYKGLSEQNLITKDYYAVVHGRFMDTEFVVDTAISHHYSDKSKMVSVVDGGRHRGKSQLATTKFRILKEQGYYSLVNATITQGVRHQIRVHLSSIKHPIVADKVYCKKKESDTLHLLFCYKVRFVDMKKTEREITVDYPEKFRPFIDF